MGGTALQQMPTLGARYSSASAPVRPLPLHELGGQRVTVATYLEDVPDGCTAILP
jgi:hypothetical protein